MTGLDGAFSIVNPWWKRLFSAAFACLLSTGFVSWAQEQDQPAPPPATPAAEGDQPPTETTDPNKYPEILEAVELFKQAKLGECLDKLNEAKEAHPEISPGRLIYAEILIKAGQVPLAKKELETVVTENPEDPRIYMAFAGLGLAEGRLMDALLEYNKALEVAKDFDFTDEKTKDSFVARCHYGLGAVYERRKSWPEAEKELAQLLEIEAENAGARQRYARTLFFQGNLDKAMEELKKAKADNDDLSSAETAFGSFYAQDKQDDKAEEWYKKGIEADPQNPLGYQTYGQWLFTQGRTSEAKDAVQQGLALIPENRQLRMLRAVLARHLKSYEEAETELQDLLRDTPKDMGVRNELALALIEQADAQKNKQAFELAAQNVRANQRSAEALATLGWVNYRLGRIEDAERILTVALRASGTQARPDLLYYYAHILADKGSNADAKKVLEQVVNSDVPFAFKDDAKQWLDRLTAADGTPSEGSIE